jgi:hypothetical protein
LCPAATDPAQYDARKVPHQPLISRSPFFLLHISSHEPYLKLICVRSLCAHTGDIVWSANGYNVQADGGQGDADHAAKMCSATDDPGYIWKEHLQCISFGARRNPSLVKQGLWPYAPSHSIGGSHVVGARLTRGGPPATRRAPDATAAGSDLFGSRLKCAVNSQRRFALRCR